MIGKITIGKSFRGCLLYCLNDKRQELQHQQVMKDRSKVLLFNKCYGNQKELIQQFNEVRQLNPKLSKPVLHITLSLAPGEELEKNKLMALSEECAKDLGFENNQYVAIHHRDTNHQHLHIVANRIGFDMRTVSDSKNYQKMANYCRKMELKYELKQVISPKRFLSKEQRFMPRYDKRKEQLREHIKSALSQSRNYSEFEQRMKERGYQIIKGRGISFVDDKKVKVKGSELNYSLHTIERILEKPRMIELKKENTKQLLQKNFFPNQSGKMLCKEKDLSLSRILKKDLSKTLEQLMKPEETHEQPGHELLKKKRKKKQQNHHL